MPDPFLSLDTEADLEAAIHRSGEEPVVLFKHSTACPVSAMANRSLRNLGSEASDPPVYRLVVQSARPLARAIADRFGIRHESPQVIVLYQGEPVFDASHSRVRADAVRQALHEAA